MRRILWKICRRLYVFVIKPILFLMSPDKVHSRMIKLTAYFGRFSFARWLVQIIFNKPRDKRLEQSYHNINFHTPVGLAAGFDKNGQIIPMISALGFSFETVGSVTAKQCNGNTRPWFYRLPKTQSIVVNAGLANDGSDVVIKRIHQYPQKTIGQFPVVLSVAKTNNNKVLDTKTGIADYVTTIKRAKNESHIKIIEINISCPNAYGGEAFTTPERLDQLLTAVDMVGVKQPIYIKMPVDLPWNAFRALLDVIVRHRVVGITIANLTKDRIKANLKDILPDDIVGNLSGKPTFQQSNELIRRTYIKYGDKLTIIGSGGIFNADDAYKKIKLGASLVEVITGLIYNGPQLVAEINDGLVFLLLQDGYTNISQAIGSDSRSGV